VDDTQARELIADVEGLLERAESLPDPVARDTAVGVAQGLLELYGEGLERIVGAVAERDDGALARALAGDELVSHLLLLHDLHPVPVAERVQGALDEVRPYLDSHGGNVELVAIEDGVARLRMEGSCSGCPSSAMTLSLAIEDAIRKWAPDIEEVRAEEAPAGVAATSGLLQIELPQARASSHPAWSMAGGVPEVPGGGPALKHVSGEPVLFVRLDERYYAYRPACPGCEGSLEEAALEGARLSCPACGNGYDVRRAGRCAEAPELHLEPVPLLVGEDGLVRVALGSPVAG
jgi:Fe-S cluster biogenesis protein NfuA/nitrite reductase/ring-hydroxylating ferredoxin subunit